MLKRVSIFLAAACAALPLLAKFDSAAWNAKCADDTEIARLKAEYDKCLAVTNSAANDIELPIEQYDEKGEVSGTLSADSCIVDRKRVTGWVPGGAVATMGDVTVSGRGIYFSFKEEFVKITTDAEIIVKSVHVDFGRLL